MKDLINDLEPMDDFDKFKFEQTGGFGIAADVKLRIQHLHGEIVMLNTELDPMDINAVY